jgi:uncharacterized alkaline shock family protein YloU
MMYKKNPMSSGVNPVLAAHASEMGADEFENGLVTTNGKSSQLTVNDKVYEAIVRRYVTRIPGVIRLTSSSLRGGIAEMIGRKSTERSVVVFHNEDGTVNIAATVVLAFEANIPETGKEIESVIRFRVEESTGNKVKSVRVIIQDLAEEGHDEAEEEDEGMVPSI